MASDGCCSHTQVEHVVSSSESQLEVLRKEIRVLKQSICELEAEKLRALDAVSSAQDQGRQLQSAAQFTERSLIVADIVIRKERCATAFRAWCRFFQNARFERDATVAHEKAIADAVDAALDAAAAQRQQELQECNRSWEQRMALEIDSVRTQHAQVAREWSGMANEDVLATSSLWCHIARSQLASNEQLWA
jgi:hypothetical protein